MQTIVSYTPEHEPRDDSFPFLVWVISYITNVVTITVGCSVVPIVITPRDIDGINEAVFSKGIGKVPKGFFVPGRNIK